MAEEIRDADLVIPWCMLSTTVINGILDFATVIVVLFGTVDIAPSSEVPPGYWAFLHADLL